MPETVGEGKQPNYERRLNMSQFSLNTFLRKSPYSLIQSYFKSKKFLDGYDWGHELDIDSLTSAILADDCTEAVLCDFENIHNMANEYGINSIIESSCKPELKMHIVDQLTGTRGYHEQSMLIFLKYPQVFQLGSELAYVDSIRSSSWKTCFTGRYVYIDTEEKSAKLSKAISEYYQSQGRGKHCVVDWFIRESTKEYCFFAYPENYAKEDLAYENGNKLTSRIRKPVMEILFVYNYGNAMLQIYSKGNRADKVLQEIFCREVLDLDGIPDENTIVYDLSKLKDTNFRFITKPEDKIESVILKSLEIHLPEKKVVVSANPSIVDERLVFDMMHQVAQGLKYDLKCIDIKKAKITVKFRRTVAARSKTVTFTVTSPNGCSLSDIPHHNTIKEYLHEWGFVSNLIAKEDAA
ncbi:MAG: hypothetical protein A2Y10_08720 [Planctomycetes bacterium GWF2_41_51]|nr:MAG: hypothetical protein A2Y10_08720 [Planctomycetes bacterium GWF2_41_51]HBG28362.1 hypothetical protein [Phycisphaerales bacterium]